MAKNLNVNLTFKADSSQAKSQIMELQGLLNKIALGTDIKINGAQAAQQISQASAAAKELALHLNNAYNATTGNFDLSKLSRSLNKAGTDINTLSSKLLAIGPTGQQAFVKLAQSIAAADRPMVTMNARLTQLWTTMKNTARWQLTSSMLHGFMGAVQTAYGYTKDLNESLNNIRIVTGQSVDQMANFAKEANKAAKSLSASTLDYTNAALIYYQQGLSNQEVQERTDVTVKMANVSRQSAEEVSDQMTAIWNNFDDGSKSLEYYADVMTALGAATASSTEEIATGLEKFAAVAETVGLSYEYATAALATVTATTRQSADVVGTAFKTLFARIQDLELGNTLDDGVTLGKYSQALNAVGISIMDQQGQLKDMNDILDDMGNKWDTLSKAQQVSLAQTVAGTRQYTQLIALMDNWSYFQENLSTAEGSTGELDKQAEIYAESWEAADKRVKASAEAIYEAILDDDFFIAITDGFSGFLDGIKAFIDGLGGIKPLIAGIGSMLLGAFSGRIVESLQNLKNNLLVTFQGAQKQASALANTMNTSVSNTLMLDNAKSKYADDKMSISTRTALQNTESLNKAKSKLLITEKDLSSAERQRFQMDLQIIETYQQERQAIADKITALHQEKNALAETAAGDIISNTSFTSMKDLGITSQEGQDAFLMQIEDNRRSLKLFIAEVAEAVTLGKSFTLGNGVGEAIFEPQLNTLNEFSEKLNNLKASNVTKVPTELANGIKGFIMNLAETIPGLEGFKVELEKIGTSKSTSRLNKLVEDTRQKLTSLGWTAEEVEKLFNQMGSKGASTLAALRKNIVQTTSENKKLKAAQDQVNAAVKNYNPNHVITGMERITAAAAGFGQAAMLINSFKSLLNALNDEDMTFGEKLTTILMSLSMIVPSVIGLYTNMDKVLGGHGARLTYLAAQYRLQQEAIEDVAFVQGIAAMASQSSTEATEEEIKAAIAATLVEHQLYNEKEAQIKASAIYQAFQKGEAQNDTKGALAKIFFGKATDSSTAATNKNTVATKLNALAFKSHPIMWIITIIMAVIAAIVILSQTLFKNSAAWKTDAEQAKALSDTVIALEESYKSLTDTVNNFKEASSEYTEAKASLEELKKGTQEYEDALKKANEQAKNLIETYGLFDKYHIQEGTNLIIIEDNALLDVEKSLQADANEAKQLLYTSKMASTAGNLRAEASELIKTGDLKLIGQIQVQQESLAKAGKNYGPDFSEMFYSATRAEKNRDGLLELGNVISDIRQSSNGLIEDADSLIDIIKNTEDISSELSEHTLQNLNSFINNETFDSLMSFVDSVDKAAEANQYYAQEILGMIVDEVHGDWLNEVAQRSGQDTADLYSRAIIKLEQDTKDSAMEAIDVSKIISDATGRIQNNGLAGMHAAITDIMEKEFGYVFDDSYNYTNTDIFKDTFGNVSFTSLAERHFSEEDIATLLVESKGHKVTSAQYKDGKIEISYETKDGEAETTSYDLETLELEFLQAFTNALANEAATQKVVNNALERESLLEQIGSSGSFYGGVNWSNQAIEAYLNNGIFDLKEIFGSIDKNEKEVLSKLTSAEIFELLGLDQNAQLMLGIGDDFITSFKAAINSWTYEQYAAGQNAIGLQQAEAFELNLDEFEAYRNTFLLTTDAYENNAKGANQVALANMRLQRGLDTLVKDWEEYSKILKDSNASDIEKTKVMVAMQKGLQDILNLDPSQFELLPSDFAIKHLDTIQKVMNGVEGAIDDLRNKAGEEILINIVGQSNFDSAIKQLHNDLINYDNLSFDVGVDIDDAAFLQSCNDMVTAAGMTAEQAQAYFAAMGYDATLKRKIDTVKLEQEYVIPTKVNQFGQPTEYEKQKFVIERQEVGTGYEIDTIAASGSYGGGVNVQTTATKSTVDAASGKSERSKNDRPTRGTDDRYKEIEDQLDNIQETMTDINREMDLSYGRGRIAAINKLVDALEKENKVLAEQRQLAANYQVVDRKNLDAIMAEGQQKYNITTKLQYNEAGDLVNWNDYWNEVYIKYQQMYDTAGDTALEEFEAWLEKAEQFADEYSQSTEKLEEIVQQMKDNIAEMMAQRFEAWNEDLELEVELSEDSINRLERALTRLEDDFYARAEAIAMIMENIPDIYSQGETDLGQSMAELNALYNSYDEYGNRKISQADYVAGMQQIQEQAEANADAVYDWIAQMKEYYADTIDQSLELFNAEMDHLDQLSSVIDHYRSITEIIDGTIDYDLTMDILESQKKNIAAQTESAKEALAMYREQMEIQKAEMGQFEEGTEQYEHAKAEYEAALAAVEEIESMLLEKAEEYASLLREIFTAQLEQFKKDLEYGLGNGKSFDEINQYLESAKALTEEWLTDTNKIYETNKLMNTAQQALDKTSNMAAKNRLSAFIKETQQLQNQGQLSNFELEVQQKKYDLLLAEIALEEAQNAKSVVRLQRDSEGNFGYVYTADADAIAKAEEDYAAADNDLYNLRLEGANEFAEKRFELDQQMHDDLAELAELYYEQGVISEEEYNRRKDEILSTYYQQVQTYAHLYNVAVRDDARITQDAWSSEYAEMVKDTEGWRDNVNTYLANIEEAWGSFQQEVDYLNTLIYDSNGEVVNSEEALRAKLEEVDSQTDKYAKTIKDELLPNLEKQITDVGLLTNAFQLELLPELLNIADAYETMAEKANEYWRAASQAAGVDIQVGGVTGEGDQTYKFGPDGDPGNDPWQGGNFEVNHNTKTQKIYDGTLYYSNDGEKWISEKDLGKPVYQDSEHKEYKVNLADFIDWNELKQLLGTVGGGRSWHDQTAWDMFDTGGYTGTWGPEGRFAMLHQKELVLNAQDTENMLAAVNIVRNLMGSVDLSIARLSSGLITPDVMPKDGWPLEQSVHIEASFPAVQDRYEIEEAFNNLINTASQFANRKRL